jgi:hypothetical protein
MEEVVRIRIVPTGDRRVRPGIFVQSRGKIHVIEEREMPYFGEALPNGTREVKLYLEKYLDQKFGENIVSMNPPEPERISVFPSEVGLVYCNERSQSNRDRNFLRLISTEEINQIMRNDGICDVEVESNNNSIVPVLIGGKAIIRLNWSSNNQFITQA